jgi:hypothetical protein
MQQDGGVILKTGAEIMKMLGQGADDGVLLLLTKMVLDAVLDTSADIAKMISLIFFLDFLSKSLFSIVFFPLFCNLGLTPLLLGSSL